MIAGNLEYLMNSLPYLSFQDTEEARSKVRSLLKRYAHPSEGEKNTLTILNEEAKKFLTPKDYHLFEHIHLSTIHSEHFQHSENKVLAEFSTYMQDLKENIGRLRIFRKISEKTSTTKKPPLPLEPGTPLEEEIQLLNWQWKKLEELSLGHYTDFGALVIYRLKLLLLERWWSFDQEQGFVNFLNATKMTPHGR
ncbi:MAG TPA: hypothetical protein VJ880_01295 [Allomuricauda sp.]|nr:hypothetical protein [Allomuricauda sp.]